MNLLLVGAVSGVVFWCLLILAQFMNRVVVGRLAGTPAGDGLAALVL